MTAYWTLKRLIILQLFSVYYISWFVVKINREVGTRSPNRTVWGGPTVGFYGGGPSLSDGVVEREIDGSGWPTWHCQRRTSSRCRWLTSGPGSPPDGKEKDRTGLIFIFLLPWATTDTHVTMWPLCSCCRCLRAHDAPVRSEREWWLVVAKQNRKRRVTHREVLLDGSFGCGKSLVGDCFRFLWPVALLGGAGGGGGGEVKIEAKLISLSSPFFIYWLLLA